MKQLLLHELRPVMLFLATFRTSGPESGQPVHYQRKPIPSLSPSLLKFALMGTFPISMASQLLADPLGERSVVPDLLTILNDKQDNSFVRGPVARALGQLGERSAVPSIIHSITTSGNISFENTELLRVLARDYSTIRTVAKLLRRRSIADQAHRILWDISQREKVRISIIDLRDIRLIRVSK